jgi:hypothetical protein
VPDNAVSLALDRIGGGRIYALAILQTVTFISPIITRTAITRIVLSFPGYNIELSYY